MNRREFLKVGSAAVAVGAISRASGEEKAATKKAKTKLIISSPVLQNAAETSVGVGFAVSDMANGFVKISESPDMAKSRLVKCGGYRVTDMNDSIMLIRLSGLKPATRYYYTIGADRISYKSGYSMSILEHVEDSRVYSFKTLGAAAESSFAVINDTHAMMKAFGRCVDKVAAINPSCVVWNGDACNAEEEISSLVKIFYTPKIERVDYAAQIPYLFVPGNHDCRGLAARHLEMALMFRQPEERASRDWDLGRNFAIRCGEMAMIGLDTGEDKLDSRDIFSGLFNMEPYREAQAIWLKDALERPEIKNAPYLVAFCHIPLYDERPKANPGDVDKNGNGRYTHDFAIWQRTCQKLWGPLLSKAGCQLIITAHQHRYRYDPPNATHSWAHLVGGGPDLASKDVEKFPTVIEGRVDGGKLKVTVHDIAHKRIAGEFYYSPRYPLA